MHTELTPEVTTILCRQAEDGVKPVRAVIAAGFSRNCWSNWRRKRDEGEQPYKDAVNAIECAEATCLANAEKLFHAARFTDWKAAEAFLKARAREDYGAKIDVTTRTGEASEMSRDELLAIAYGQDADEG